MSSENVPPIPQPVSSKHTGAGFDGGHAVWSYEEGTWVLAKQACALGYGVGGPPRESGAYPGQMLRKHCEPVVEPAATGEPVESGELARA